MGFEPMMRVLQTLALPLGHVANQVLPKKDFTILLLYNKVLLGANL